MPDEIQRWRRKLKGLPSDDQRKVARKTARQKVNQTVAEFTRGLSAVDIQEFIKLALKAELSLVSREEPEFGHHTKVLYEVALESEDEGFLEKARSEPIFEYVTGQTYAALAWNEIEGALSKSGTRIPNNLRSAFESNETSRLKAHEH